MKKLIKTIVISLCFWGVSNAYAAPIVIKFSHVVAEKTPKGQMALKFQELVAKEMGDKVVVEVFPNSQLFSDDNVLEALQLGDVQMASPAVSKFRKYTNKLQLFDLPFLFKDIKAVTKFENSESGVKLLRSVQRRGLLGLGYVHSGMKQLTSNIPLQKPADAKGLKFRVMSSDVLAAQMNAVGALPVKKPFSEVFPLLQTKAIDGQENSWSNIYSKKFFEVQKYITESNHGVINYMVVTSDKFWSGLDPATRTKLEELLKEAIEYGNQVSDALEAKDRQLIIDSKETTVLSLTDEERAAWVKSMKPVWDKFKGEIGEDLINEALKSN